MMAAKPAMTANGATALPVEGAMPPLDGAVEWLNSPPLTAEGAARQGRADRFLDVLVRQLPAHAAVRARVVRQVQGPGPRRDRRARAGVRVREGHRQRAPRGQGSQGRLSGRDRQRLRDLARVRQPATGPRTTSSTRKAASAITSSAKANTRNPKRSSSSCSPKRAPTNVAAGVVQPDAGGVAIAPANADVQSPETYVGYDRAENFASPGGAVRDSEHDYAIPPQLATNQWGLAGAWTIADEKAQLARAGGRIAFRFHARDLNLVLGPGADGKPVQATRSRSTANRRATIAASTRPPTAAAR